MTTLQEPEPKRPLTKGRIGVITVIWVAVAASEIFRHRDTTLGQMWHAFMLTFSAVMLGLCAWAFYRVARGQTRN